MKPAPFLYHAPTSLEQAARMLAELDGDVRLTAGGQSLIPMMNLRVARPDHLVDLQRIPELTGVEREANRLLVGATTTHREVETSPLVRDGVPLLGEMASNIGHIPIRQRGTIGGSVSLADPTAEMPLATVMLDAELVLTSLRGARTVKAGDFFLGAMVTDLADDEILTRLEFPLMDVQAGSAFLEYAQRKGDFCLAGVAAIVRVADGRFTSARIGLCGVSDKPFLSEIASQLTGTPATAATASEIAAEIAAEFEPMADGRATEADRRDIAKALIERVLPLACDRAKAAAQGVGS